MVHKSLAVLAGELEESLKRLNNINKLGDFFLDTELIMGNERKDLVQVDGDYVNAIRFIKDAGLMVQAIENNER